MIEVKRRASFWAGRLTNNLEAVFSNRMGHFLVYPPGTQWRSETMPILNFWLQQLYERSELILDTDRLTI